jgi:hypothetical protein
LSSATCAQPQPLAYQSYSTSDFNFFFSASSFYPGRQIDIPQAPAHFLDVDHLSDTNSGETDIESENDWHTDPGDLQPSGSGSRVSSSLALEVRFWPFFCLSNLAFFVATVMGGN